MSGARRLPFLVVLAALLAGAVLVDRDPPAEDVRTFGRADVFVMPVSAPASALTSTWYCPGAPATADGETQSIISVINPGERDSTGTITAYPQEGDPKRQELVAESRRRAQVRLSDVLAGDYVGAVVELPGGAMAVEVTTDGPDGREETACATGASSRWYFANGRTTRDAQEVLTLFNPFPDDAIVDIRFATDEGTVVAPGLQALPVPAGRVLAIDVNQHARRQQLVATAVEAKTGRLVVGRLQTYDGSAGPEGLMMSLGAPAAGGEWYFPEGQTGKGLVERFRVFNPTDREAVVDVELFLDKGFTEPFTLSIPPFGTAVVDASAEKRVPKGVAHSALVSSLNGVPVVAERSVDATEGATRKGSTSMLGSRLLERRWLLAAGGTSDRLDEWVVVQNPTTDAVRVSVRALSAGREVAISELQDVEIAPAGRLAVRLNDRIERPDLPLLVIADRPVAVERDLYLVDRLGMSSAIGIPLAD